MIDKLKKNIFWLVQSFLTIIIIIIIVLFIMFGYRDVVMSSILMMDKVNMKPGGKDAIASIDAIQIEVEGFYSFTINNEIIIDDNPIKADSKISQIAIEASQKNNESGIINNYVYKVKKIGNNERKITLLENKTMISNYKIKTIVSIIVGSILICITYIISKKITKQIVKPVEETFEKQKQFVSDASHELKTPLAVIEANSEVLEAKEGNSKWITYIQNETQNMNKLVNDLLVLSKTEDNIINNYQTFNISKQIAIGVSSFEALAYEKQIKIETKLQENIEYYGDKEELQHVLSILLDNAIKHTQQAKNIYVTLLKEKKNIILKVENEGEEIPKEEREKIFERFYRIDKARNRAEKRYGLGLAIAKAIVEKYNGKIEVQCKNGVTSFIVTI